MFTGSKWHKKPQVVWKQIMEHEPDLWIWLGDGTLWLTKIQYLPLVLSITRKILEGKEGRKIGRKKQRKKKREKERN